MKKVTEKTWEPQVLEGQSPEPRTGVFNESNKKVKREFEVTMGLYRKGACLIKKEYQISK